MKSYASVICVLLCIEMSIAAVTLFDDFKGTSVDTNKWRNTGGASPNQGAKNTATFEVDKVSIVNNEYLRLELNQEIASKRTGLAYFSEGGSSKIEMSAKDAKGQIWSQDLYGYGIYSWRARMPSNDANPTGSDTSTETGGVGEFLIQYKISGQPDKTALSFQVEGRDPNKVTLTSIHVGNSQTTSLTQQNNDGFHIYTIVWTATKVSFYVDDVLQQEQTTVVPTNPGRILLSHYGTNNASFGGDATVGTRYMYVDWFSYTDDTSSPCIATDTCADLNAECGEIDNGCNMVACGACTSGQTCSNKKCVSSSGSSSSSSSTSDSPSTTTTSTGCNTYSGLLVKVTVTIQTGVSDFNVNVFVGNLAALLQIPEEAIDQVQIDWDMSTSTTTYLTFLLKSVDCSDPVAVAQQLKQLSTSNNGLLQQYNLNGLQVVENEDNRWSSIAVT